MTAAARGSRSAGPVAEPLVLAAGADGPPVARYAWRPELPGALAPRPYLDPVRTLAGAVVTESTPASHRHHLGVSIAFPDIAGANFWGGRTFVAGHGPAWLSDHGRQEHRDWLRRSPDEITHTLRWVTADGGVLLTERRSIACRPVDETAWALEVDFALTNATERALTVRTPAALGRPGAGYGGFFWRVPTSARDCRAFGPAGADLTALHGGTGDWLALTGRTDEQGWTLVFAGADEPTRRDRWFVRVRDYAGVGSSPAWDEPLPLPPGGLLARRITTVVADGVLPAGRAAELAVVAVGSGR
nr:PmoA family protein [Micromonospora sp. DSM 115978]